jgi:hypothetical protein
MGAGFSQPLIMALTVHPGHGRLVERCKASLEYGIIRGCGL